MMKRPKEYKLRTIFNLTFLLLIIIITLTIILSLFLGFKKIFKERTINAIVESAGQATYNVNLNIQRIENISLSLLSHQDMELLADLENAPDEYVRSEFRTKIINIIYSFSFNNNIKNIHIMTDEGEFFFAGIIDLIDERISTDSIKNSPIYNIVKNSNGETILYTDSIGLSNTVSKDKKTKMYLARKIKSKYIGNKVLGYLFMEINIDHLNQLYKGQYWEDEGVCMLIKDGQPISSVGSAACYSQSNWAPFIQGNKGHAIDVLNDKKSLISWYKLDYGDLYLLVAVPYSVILKDLSKATSSLYVVMVFTILFAACLSLLVAYSITKPINKLLLQMKGVTKENLDIEMRFSIYKELNLLTSIFAEMMERIKNLIQSNKEEHELKRKSDIKLLQYQINPHFFYNTLDTVNWLAQSAGQKNIVEIVTALSKLYRISLSKGNDEITIREELEHVEQFLKISKIRLGDFLEYDIHAEKEIMDCRTVKLILQPIVENAIMHGVNKVDDYGYIQIDAYMKNNDIVFEVKDNGVGISEHELERITQYINRVDNTIKGSFGLRNINDRIQLLHGSRYGIVIEPLERGTKVTVVIPNYKEQNQLDKI